MVKPFNFCMLPRTNFCV